MRSLMNIPLVRASFFAFVFTVVMTAVVSPAFAETFFLKRTVGTGLQASEIESVHELVRMGVQGVSGAQIVDSEAQAESVLETKVVKLGSAYILGITRLKGGTPVFSQQARAKTFDDMDTVAARVARAVINQVSVEGDAKVTDVTEEEVTRQNKRMQATRQWTFKLGPGVLSNLGDDGTGTGWSLGYAWGVDSNFDLRLAFNLVDGKASKSSASDLSLGISYYFDDGKASPYIGADFGYGWASAADSQSFLVSKDTVSSFVLGAETGVKFFRTSSVNMSVGARYLQYFGRTSHGAPSAASLLVGVYF